MDLAHPQYEESHSTVKAADDDGYFHLTLNIHYETKFGEYLCVTGDIPELGSWKNFKCRLQWTDGHIWTTPKPIKTKNRIIQYKYLVWHQQDEPKEWEHGQNRLADLNLLESKEIDLGSSNPKQLKLVDVWNSFSIKFSIFYPTNNDSDEILLRGLKHNQDLRMTRSSLPVPWLPNKYGENVRVFEGYMLMSNNDIKRDHKSKMALPIKYKYILNRYGKKKSILERNNNLRIFNIGKATEYSENVDDLESKNGEIYIINGQAEVREGNFIRPFVV